jgi:hypothetical protein
MEFRGNRVIGPSEIKTLPLMHADEVDKEIRIQKPFLISVISVYQR